MKKFISAVTLFSTLIISGAMYAESTPAAKGSAPIVDDEICQFLVEHHPVPGVEYEPGIDVHGKPVIEAETSVSMFQATPDDEIKFDINVDMAKYIGVTVPGDALEAQAKFGTIEYKNGIMTLDGKPLSPENDASLRSLCDKKPAAADVPPASAPPAKAP